MPLRPGRLLIRGGSKRPVLDLNFAASRALDSRITFSRTGTATYFDKNGVLQTAASGVARFDFDPATLQSLGLRVEEARTNSLRNSTMLGASAGSPGTLPTNWGFAGGTTAGLTSQVVGSGTESGINYVDLRFSGTPAATFFAINYEGAAQIAATAGQVWTQSAFVSLVGGSLTNVGNIAHRIDDLGNSVSFNASPLTISAGPLNARRANPVISSALGASATFVRGGLGVNLTVSAAVDFTLRIGLPQLELGAFATSPIPTSTVAVTRNTDAATMTLPTGIAGSPSALTAVVKWRTALATDGSAPQCVFSLDDGTANNRIQMRRLSGAGANVDAPGIAGGVGGSVVAYPAAPSNTDLSAFVGATAGALTGQAVGQAKSSVSSMLAMPTGLTTLHLGADQGGTSRLNSTLARLQLFPQRLSDSTALSRAANL